MFDIGFFEILLIGIIALLILGPKRLPGFLTKLEEYVKLIRSKGTSISQEIKQEIYSEDFENKEKNKDD
ncbi:MAG: Sec-independent protein translocase protein TatB [Gammaproteobacteria bacterium]|tara:strand:+ start:1963 stop:2169 length:207 start_codon:yes stop_codon:yes gene_type:complete